MKTFIFLMDSVRFHNYIIKDITLYLTKMFSRLAFQFLLSFTFCWHVYPVLLDRAVCQENFRTYFLLEFNIFIVYIYFHCIYELCMNKKIQHIRCLSQTDLERILRNHESSWWLYFGYSWIEFTSTMKTNEERVI